MFHNVFDDLDTYSISKNNFEKMIRYLNDNKKIVDVDELINNPDKNNVVITFDDAEYKIVGWGDLETRFNDDRYLQNRELNERGER